ncbi:hypothetical protein [Viridibacillus arvi]|uniref:hypothetical protein n=1 Tax=Viridibacillus arvi TaxID=263475 RepID=UPI003D00DEBB
MFILFTILFILFFLATGVFAIIAIINFIKKNSANGKKMLIFTGASFVVIIVSLIGMVTTVPDTESADGEKTPVTKVVAKETAAEKADREAKEIEEKEKKEKEAKEKAEKEKAVAKEKAKKEALAKAKAEKEAKEKAKAQRKKALDALKLTGTGDTGTKKFKLKDGFVIIKAKHTGGSNFAVKLLDENANPLELVVNEIGNYEGSQIYNVTAGNYLFDITASGNWSIQMSQFVPSKIANVNAQGRGDSVVFMNLESGANTFNFTHNGQSNFAVKANDTNLLVNEIGSYKGSTIQKVEDSGVYYFNITADGNWTMKAE